MGLSTRLEKPDQKPTRGYAHWGRWVWWMPITVPVLVVLWNIGQTVWGDPRDGVILEIHGEVDRSISGFSVNGVTDASAFMSGGGSIICCDDVSGDMAEAIWTLSTVRTQYSAGIRLRKRNRTLPLPKREWEESYLYAYFIPGDKVLLGRSRDSFSPYEDLYNGGSKIRVRQDVKNKLYGTRGMN